MPSDPAFMLSHALAYARDGIPVFPCWERDETEDEFQERKQRTPLAAHERMKRKYGKNPRTRHGYLDATTDEDQIRRWWRQWPDAAIGVPTGPSIGMWVLDVDLPKREGDDDGRRTLADLEAIHGALPATREQRTGSGGRQLFFAWEEGRHIPNSAGNKLGRKLDVRGQGGYVILPPSLHPCGGRYEWISDTYEPAAAPEWIVAMVEKKPEPKHERTDWQERPTPPGYGAAALEGEARKVASAPQGERNHTLNTAAFSMGTLIGGRVLDRPEVERVLLDAARACGLSEDEAMTTMRSGLDAGEAKPRTAPERPREERGQERSSAGQETTKPRLGFHAVADLLRQPSPPRWLIRGHLDACSLSSIFGSSGSMKTFVALDIGLCLATGIDWHGNAIGDRGGVIYVCGEGLAGINKRLMAWFLEHPDADPKQTPFFVSDAPVPFLNPDALLDAKKSIKALVALHGYPKLIIVDTLARNFGPGDESKTPDMCAFVDALTEISKLFDCAVMVVHHTGLADANRARGNSSLRGALDWEYKLDTKDSLRVLSCAKSKDFIEPNPIAFEPVSIDTGWRDDEGQPVTSLVMRKSEEPVEKETSKKSKPLTGANRVAYFALRELSTAGDIVGASALGVPLEDWRAECYNRSITPSTEQNAKRQAFRRAVTYLRDNGLIKTENDLYWPADLPWFQPKALPALRDVTKRDSCHAPTPDVSVTLRDTPLFIEGVTSRCHVTGADQEEEENTLLDIPAHEQSDEVAAHG